MVEESVRELKKSVFFWQTLTLMLIISQLGSAAWVYQELNAKPKAIVCRSLTIVDKDDQPLARLAPIAKDAPAQLQFTQDGVNPVSIRHDGIIVNGKGNRVTIKPDSITIGIDSDEYDRLVREKENLERIEVPSAYESASLALVDRKLEDNKPARVQLGVAENGSGSVVVLNQFGKEISGIHSTVTD